MCLFSYWWFWESSQLNHLIGYPTVIDVDATGNHRRNGLIAEILHKSEYPKISQLRFKYWICLKIALQVSFSHDYSGKLNSLQQIAVSRFTEIQKNQLFSFGLQNLHKLAFVNCTLVQVDKDAFSGLSILIELDLSVNHIKVIHAGTFHTLIKIRKISLRHNEIESISDRTFENLQHLSIVELDNNKIHSVGEQAFLNVIKIKMIYLANNRLRKLEKLAFTNMPALTELTLNDNLWNCTCELKDFRNHVVEKKLSTDTKCHYPKQMKNRLWTDITEDEFSCSPQIFVPRGIKSMRASRANETITCQVRGTPPPTIEWLFNSRSIRESEHYHIRVSEKTPKTISHKDEHLKHVMSELTIVGLRAADKGRYSCKASNIGGQDEVTIALEIPPDSLSDNGIFLQTSSSSAFFMILCIIIGILFIVMFTICILCCYCRRVNKYDKKPSSDNTLLMSQQNGLTTKLNGKSQSESILDGGSVIMELQKNLLTEVNPVEKPPRRTEVDSIEKDGDDVSDLKQTLLDETTTYGKLADIWAFSTI